jgi:hypothetical protein
MEIQQIIEMLARMEAKMDANQGNAAKEEEMLAEIIVRMDGDLKDLKEEIKCDGAETRSTVCGIGSDLQETMQREM